MHEKQIAPELAAGARRSRSPGRHLLAASRQRLSRVCTAALGALVLLWCVGLPATALASVVRFQTPLGSFDVELFDEDAPRTVENFLNYVKDGDYEKSFIHRLSRGFVVQGGGYTFVDGDVQNVPADPPVANEFKRSNVRGTIAMAKVGGDPDSATSQWFINLADNSDNLDSQNGGFTVFGRVLGDGMDVVDAIAALPGWNFGGAFTNLPLIDFQSGGSVQDENIVFTNITLLDTAETEIDVTDVADISGDTVPDIAYLRSKDQPKVRYYSGATGQKIRVVKYFGTAWTGVAAATVADGNADGVADDPAVAVLATKTATGKHAVEVRRAGNGALITKLDFLGPSWQVLDVAVIDDRDGDGVSGDTVVAVLGFDPARPFDERIRVQARRLGDGRPVGNWFFLNGNWTPLALEAVHRPGKAPLLALLANKPATGENVVQARSSGNGRLQPRLTFMDANWLARDIAVLNDANGDGIGDDPAYLVLVNHKTNQRNKVHARLVSSGKGLKRIDFLGAKWEARRLTGVGDVSGNLAEEVGTLAKRRTDGRVTVQSKDFADGTVSLRFSP